MQGENLLWAPVIPKKIYNPIPVGSNILRSTSDLSNREVIFDDNFVLSEESEDEFELDNDYDSDDEEDFILCTAPQHAKFTHQIDLAQKSYSVHTENFISRS